MTTPEEDQHPDELAGEEVEYDLDAEEGDENG